MKKNLLFIFALLCAVAQGVWAYDQVIDLKDWNSDVSVTANQHWIIYGNSIIFRHRIIIQDGATVTLYGVNINGNGAVTEGNYAGITCLGNATIILDENTTNTVKGFNRQYPGIYTLTIKGAASLNVSSNSNGTLDPIAPGIGGPAFGSCGNIEIQGGTITATGGYSSAGIGCGPSAAGSTPSESEPSSCGNITISGGNVTATGGKYAAGKGPCPHGARGA